MSWQRVSSQHELAGGMGTGNKNRLGSSVYISQESTEKATMGFSILPLNGLVDVKPGLDSLSASSCLTRI